MRAAWLVVRVVGSGLAKSARSWRRCYLLALVLGIVAGVGAIAGSSWSWWALAVVLIGAGFPGAVWQARWPESYERRVVGAGSASGVAEAGSSGVVGGVP